MDRFSPLWRTGFPVSPEAAHLSDSLCNHGAWGLPAPRHRSLSQLPPTINLF